MLVNKKPKWDETQKGHVLNFEAGLCGNALCCVLFWRALLLLLLLVDDRDDTLT